MLNIHWWAISNEHSTFMQMYVAFKYTFVQHFTDMCWYTFSHDEYANSTQTFGSTCRNQLCAESCGQCQCSVINKTLQYQNGFHSIIQLQVPFYQPQVPCSNLYPPSLPDFQDFPDITLVHGGGNLFSTFLTCLILFTFQVIFSS